MNHIIKTIGLALLFFCMSCRSSTEIKENIFILEKKISLDNKINIGGASSFDINKNGDFLIADSQLKQVLLFKQDGSFIRKLSYEECDQGLVLEPLSAKFHPNGSIFVMLNGPIGIWFKADGTCSSKTKPTLLPTSAYDIDKNGFLYIFQRDSNSKLQIHDSLGVIIKDFSVQNDFPNAHTYITAKSILLNNDNLYIALPLSSKALQYSLDGDLLNTYPIEDATLRLATKDVSNPSSSEVAELLVKYSTIQYTNFIGENLLVTYFSPSKSVRNSGEEYINYFINKNEKIAFSSKTNFIPLKTFQDKIYAFYKYNKNEANEICPKCGGIVNIGIAVYGINKKYTL